MHTGPLAWYFPGLSVLDLSSNLLTGAVPLDLGAGATKMAFLLLGGNQLRGGRLMMCFDVYVEGTLQCEFTALITVPSDLGAGATKMAFLMLGGNQLRGGSLI